MIHALQTTEPRGAGVAETKAIIVPLDGSKIAEYALPAAGWYSKLTGAPLKFIHVIDGDMPADKRPHAADTFQKYADELAASAGMGKADCLVLAGNPAEQILSASVSAAAIVMASRGRGGFKAMVVGSVADKVVRGSVVPILVEPGTEEPSAPKAGKPILVGLDGSAEAERGLASARELAAAEKRPIAVLRTYSIPPPVGIEFATYPADLSTTMEQAARAYLGEVTKPGEQAIIRQGDATTAILEAADEIDACLIVLTSSGKGLTKRIALGSTTDRVIHGTNRPVLVIPPAAS